MIGIAKFLKNNILKIKVVPNSQREELIETESGLKLYLKAAPEKGKANQEVIKFFKKEFGLRASIEKGEKSREKVLRVL